MRVGTHKTVAINKSKQKRIEETLRTLYDRKIRLERKQFRPGSKLSEAEHKQLYNLNGRIVRLERELGKRS